MSTWKVTVEADRDLAHTLAGVLQNLIEPTPDALTVFEDCAANGAAWRVDAYFADMPDLAVLAEDLSRLIDRPIPPLSSDTVPELNWVAISQAALPPVRAGRFTVHGSHDRHRVPRGPGAILIDAGEAFGTAHHATTFGCLEAIDRLTRVQRARNILDLGCGSGILAIALARALPRARVLATDLDRQSIVVARENMRLNGIASRIRAVHANGLASPHVRRRAPFDVIVANILAGPLIKLAPDVSRALRPRGRLILSGILLDQAPKVIAAYRAQGFSVLSHQRATGWSTLQLVRSRALAGRRRQTSGSKHVPNV